MNTISLPLERIKLEQHAQPRVELDDAYTEEITNDLQAGNEFPPVVVFYNGEDYWLADGFHRYFAHQKAGRSDIKAEVREGGMREAILHSVGANATHGKRRSNADKRKAVETLLQDEDWSKWSDRFIADACRVSQPFVSRIRQELTDNGYQFPDTRICSDNRQMNVAQIGSNRGQDSQEAQASAAASENLQEMINASAPQARTDEDAAGSHPVEETPDTVNSESGTNQVDDSGSTGERQIDIPEASALETEDQTEDTGPSVEPESEVNSDEGEATEHASEEASQIEANDNLSQEAETEFQDFDDDIPTLKAKVVELQEALQARDLKIQKQEMVIQELKAKVWNLQKENDLYEKEIKCYADEELAREQANESQWMVSEATI